MNPLSLLESFCGSNTNVAMHIMGKPNWARLSAWQSISMLLFGRSTGYPLWCGQCGVKTKGRWLWGYRFDCARGRRYPNVYVVTRR